ncbi:MAG: glycosyltransferase [Proteobacteria bacterium]|nr:glycosyltransferase [Pseudomonadota bacterium]
MRVLIIGPILPYLGGRTTGGVAMDCTNQAIYLKKNNVEVAIIAHNTFSNQKYRQYKGINIYYFPKKTLFMLHSIYNLISNDYFAKVVKYTKIVGILKAFKMIGRMYTIKRAIRDFKPDLIHIHDVIYFPEIKYLTNNIPIVVTVHALTSLSSLYTSKSEVRIHKLVYRKSFKELKYVVTVSEYMKEKLNKHYKGHIHIINNHVEFNHNIYKISPNKKNDYSTLIYIGHLKKGKGIYDLIKVANILKNKLKFRLIIVGDGEEKSNLYKEIKKNKLGEIVNIYGQVEHEEIFKLLDFADLFVTCSYGETWGNVLFEAFSKGVPVVAYDNTVMREVIPNYAGLLAKDRDLEDFSQKVLCALNTNWNRKRIKRYAYEHSWEKGITDFINYFKYVLENEDYLKKKRSRS